MKILLTATLGLVLASALTSAQTLDVNLDALSAKAKDKAEVTLEGSLLTQALRMAPPNVNDAAANVSRVTLRHYEFDKTGQYADTDLDAIRKQVSNWSRILNVKDEHRNVELYMLAGQDGKPQSFLLIAAEPKQLTVVHLIGSIDLASLREVVNSTIHYNLQGPGVQ